MMINNLNGFPQCILILNPNQINNALQQKTSMKPQNVIHKDEHINLLSNMKAICSPCLVVPQNSLISFVVKPEKMTDTQSEIPPKKSPFTYEEDELLLKLVEKYGKNDWRAISMLMKKYNSNRNVRQCKDRYFHYLDPKIRKNPEWTKEEDELLQYKVVEMGNKWKAMEKFFPGRTEISLRNRYKLLLRKETKDERRKERKKKNIMSNEFSFLDKISSSNSKNNTHKKKQNDDVFENQKDIEDLDKFENSKLYSTFNLDHDIFFENEYEQESQVWIDEELNGYFN